jgi:hypothetical protein
MTTETTNTPNPGKPRILQAILKYLGAYVLGILTCITFTPVKWVLAGKPLFLLFPALAPIGFFLYFFYLSPQYVFGPRTAYWLVGAIALIPVVLGAATFFTRAPRLRTLRPLWIGFPIGFLGTLGVYYTAAASI